MNYEEFIASKKVFVEQQGFTVDSNLLNTKLFPFQRYCVEVALKAGRYALFEDCGLGKTLQQLAWAEQVVIHTNLPVVILTPLSVAAQTIDEAQKFGIQNVLRWSPDLNSKAIGSAIYVAHYEQLSSLPTGLFSGVVLDESSILKNFEGATKKALIESFVDTPYKLCCTATPSPNDPMELGNHAEFLGVMSRAQMLAMYFVHDGGDTSKWRLKGHCQDLFWSWVASWATMMAKPSDIGFSDAGYQLPALNLIDKQIKTPQRDNWQLFNDVSVSATNFNQELRLTQLERIDEAAAIVNGSSEPFIIWIRHNEEGAMLRKLIPEAVEVAGSDSPEIKESRLIGFAKGEFRVLITKAKIAQFGMNYQHCANQVFASVDFSFEGLYQAIRRSYRFGQKRPVNIYMVTTDTMQNVATSIKRKQSQFDAMQTKMTKAINRASASTITHLQPLKLPSWLTAYAS